MVKGEGWRVKGVRCRVKGEGCRMKCIGLRMQGLEFRVFTCGAVKGMSHHSASYTSGSALGWLTVPNFTLLGVQYKSVKSRARQNPESPLE